MAKQKKSTFERLRSGTMNRQQRRDLGRRLAGNDPGLTIVHPNAGGIDVGNDSHFVAVPPDRDVAARFVPLGGEDGGRADHLATTRSSRERR